MLRPIGQRSKSKGGISAGPERTTNPESNRISHMPKNSISLVVTGGREWRMMRGQRGNDPECPGAKAVTGRTRHDRAHGSPNRAQATGAVQGLEHQQSIAHEHSDRGTYRDT